MRVTRAICFHLFACTYTAILSVVTAQVSDYANVSHAIADRPNILFCISDDQSYAHTGANGDPVVQHQRLIVSHEKGFGLHMHFVMHQPVGHLDQRFSPASISGVWKKPGISTAHCQQSSQPIRNCWQKQGTQLASRVRDRVPADWSPVVVR